MERIFLVDDDIELCELLPEYFAAEGFDVESAHDGVRGLERARSGAHALVILDLLLPGLRGLDVLRQLRHASNVRGRSHRTRRRCRRNSVVGARGRRLLAEAVQLTRAPGLRACTLAACSTDGQWHTRRTR